ncbi:Bax inhibitor-1 family protein [Nitrincola sp. A-D6]|uniref:Bax inhibitor-1 family protein n=1 Tax=Nitrincola sp. A-D6 TaxID=1545442 RepID=UPI00190F5485|nr:Bax inhibitor-1 family protein [Nitrincola sp. A-D6]
MEVDVFDRTSTTDPVISPTAYNLAIGLTLCWGFAINWLMVVNIDPQAIASIEPWIFIIGFFASCFFGIYLFNGSTNPLVSFIGYNFVVVPFGLIINLVVSQFDPTLVSEAIRITGLVTIGMMCLGSLYPAFFQSISGALTIALLLVIVVELIEWFVFGVHHGVIDWIVVLIFCGYIGYDWGRANQICVNR